MFESGLRTSHGASHRSEPVHQDSRDDSAADKRVFAGGNEDARDRRLSSSYGRFQRKAGCDDVQPVFPWRASDQSPDSGTESNPGLCSGSLHRSGYSQDGHGGTMQMRLRHQSGTGVPGAVPGER